MITTIQDLIKELEELSAQSELGNETPVFNNDGQVALCRLISGDTNGAFVIIK
jgi:hypothetical protein